MKKLLILQNEISSYSVPVYNIIAGHYDLTVGYYLKDKSKSPCFFKKKKLESFVIGPLTFVKGIGRLTSQYDVVCMIPNMRNPSYCVLPFLRRRFKLVNWSIGFRASYTNPYITSRKHVLADKVFQTILSRCDASIFYMEKAKEQLEELPERLRADETFVNAAKNSNKETAMQQCAASLMMIVAGMLNENTEFCRYYLDNPDFMAAINNRVFDSVYSGLLSSFRKLQSVEDDKDVRNLIFGRLHMDSNISDGDLQIEVQKRFGERYPGMSNNDWRHIIEAYTSMVREAAKPKAIELPLSYPMAAEDESNI